MGSDPVDQGGSYHEFDGLALSIRDNGGPQFRTVEYGSQSIIRVHLFNPNRCEEDGSERLVPHHY